MAIAWNMNTPSPAACNVRGEGDSVSGLAGPRRHATLAALCAVQSLALTLFPLHFFFHFLFYTDVGSVTFTLAAYLVRGTAIDVAAWLWDTRR